jgi:hypothetical protein
VVHRGQPVEHPHPARPPERSAPSRSFQKAPRALGGRRRGAVVGWRLRSEGVGQILFSTLFYECATAMRPIAGEEREGGSGSEGRRAVAGPWARLWWARTGRCCIRLVARPPGFGGFYASDPVGPAFLGLGLPTQSRG